MKSFFLSLASIFIPLSCMASNPSPRLAYFCASYDQCRTNFLAAAAPYADAGATQGKLKIPSKIDDALYTDYLYLPAKSEARNLLVLSSGVHGVEGFGGSSVQQYFFKEVLPTLDRRNLGILFLHAVNPYGMKYLRR